MGTDIVADRHTHASIPAACNVFLRSHGVGIALPDRNVLGLTLALLDCTRPSLKT